MLLRYVPQLFDVLLVAGALYVAWVGWTLARSSITVNSLALAAGRGRDALVGRPAVTRLVGRIAGLLLIAVATLTLWRGWNAG